MKCQRWKITEISSKHGTYHSLWPTRCQSCNIHCSINMNNVDIYLEKDNLKNNGKKLSTLTLTLKIFAHTK